MAALEQDNTQPHGSIWSALPDALRGKVVSFLPANEVACSVRLVNKAAATQFDSPGNRTIRLSQPVPLESLTAKWHAGSPAWRKLGIDKRRRLLRLVAASGVLENLELVMQASGCAIKDDLMEAAAEAAQQHICAWLRQLGCPWGDALLSAARGGSLSTCEWLVANGCLMKELGREMNLMFTVCAAANGAAINGHSALLEWLLQRLPDPSGGCSWVALENVAQGCDLATLQWVYGEHRRGKVSFQGTSATKVRLEGTVNQTTLRGSLAAAARSATPDWRQKFEWLEAQGGVYPLEEDPAAASSSTLLDLPARAREREDRRLHGLDQALDAAARGDMTSFAILMAACPGPRETKIQKVSRSAAGSGNLAALQAMRAHGQWERECEAQALQAAAEGGHLAVVEWLVGALGLSLQQMKDRKLGEAAAQSGRVELLAWLRERGYECDTQTFCAAVAGGCAEAVELLAHLAQEVGNPEPRAHPYAEAAGKGDMATLELLRRLGCSFQAGADIFSTAVVRCAPIAALQWLLDAGCSVDWRDAQGMLMWRDSPDHKEIGDWMRQRRRQERGSEEEEEEELAQPGACLQA